MKERIIQALKSGMGIQIANGKAGTDCLSSEYMALHGTIAVPMVGAVGMPRKSKHSNVPLDDPQRLRIALAVLCHQISQGDINEAVALSESVYASTEFWQTKLPEYAENFKFSNQPHDELPGEKSKLHTNEKAARAIRLMWQLQKCLEAFESISIQDQGSWRRNGGTYSIQGFLKNEEVFQVQENSLDECLLMMTEYINEQQTSPRIEP